MLARNIGNLKRRGAQAFGYRGFLIAVEFEKVVEFSHSESEASDSESRLELELNEQQIFSLSSHGETKAINGKIITEYSQEEQDKKASLHGQFSPIPNPAEKDDTKAMAKSKKRPQPSLAVQIEYQAYLERFNECTKQNFWCKFAVCYLRFDQVVQEFNTTFGVSCP